MDGDTYRCPVCDKPFDMTDRLADFALSAHMKDHAPERNNPANLIRFETEGLMWTCKLCGAPLHAGEFTARQMVIGHCRVMHGSVPGSSAPVTAGGGRSGGSGSRGKGIANAIGDIAEDVFGAIGGALGKILGD